MTGSARSVRWPDTKSGFACTTIHTGTILTDLVLAAVAPNMRVQIFFTDVASPPAAAARELTAPFVATETISVDFPRIDMAVVDAAASVPGCVVAVLGVLLLGLAVPASVAYFNPVAHGEKGGW